MTDEGDAFLTKIATARRDFAKQLIKPHLRIAVLGPNLKDIHNAGTQKRKQIANALSIDGHESFFPEDHLQYDDPSKPWLEQERQLLCNDSVDLIIVLNTENSAGVLMEIGNFAGVPEICCKTAILFPAQHFSPTQNLPGNTVNAYFTSTRYTQEDMDTCSLVSECTEWAYSRQHGSWPDLPYQGF